VAAGRVSILARVASSAAQHVAQRLDAAGLLVTGRRFHPATQNQGTGTGLLL